MSAGTIFGESKYFASGQKRTRVPLSRGPALPVFFSGSFTWPLRPNTMRHAAPSRFTSTSSLVDSALLTHTPTPCRPPAMRYTASLSVLRNLPPECSVVKITCTAGTFFFGWMSTGMPRPSSITSADPSSYSVTATFFAKPARPSSAELSMISTSA